MYLGIIGTLVVNRSMPILYGSARLFARRVRSKHDLRPSLADLSNVPARLGPLRFVGACRLAWRSGQISDSETDLLRAAESLSFREG